MKIAYIIHGYAATPNDHWFQAVANHLENSGIDTHLLNLPDSRHPSPIKWLQYLNENITQLNNETVIIAHSLGSVTAIRYLLSLDKSVHIKGFISVAGFTNNLPNLPQLNEFTNQTFPINRLKTITTSRAVIVSDNDTIVNPEYTKNLAKQLEAQLYTVENGGHFLASDGFTDFKLVVSIAQDMLKQED